MASIPWSTDAVQREATHAQQRSGPHLDALPNLVQPKYGLHCTRITGTGTKNLDTALNWIHA
jgi:hypothetical protein